MFWCHSIVVLPRIDDTWPRAKVYYTDTGNMHSFIACPRGMFPVSVKYTLAKEQAYEILGTTSNVQHAGSVEHIFLSGLYRLHSSLSSLSLVFELCKQIMSG